MESKDLIMLAELYYVRSQARSMMSAIDMLTANQKYVFEKVSEMIERIEKEKRCDIQQLSI